MIPHQYSWISFNEKIKMNVTFKLQYINQISTHVMTSPGGY